MTVNDMLLVLEKQGKFKTDKRMYQTALYFYGAIMLNKFNFRKEKREGNEKFINYYAITLGDSGSGKSFSKSTVEKLFELKSYSANMHRMHSMLSTYDPDISKFIPNSAIVGLEGTKEGLFSIANAQALSGYGSLNLESEEMGGVVASSNELMEKLKELYDGKYKAKIIKGTNDSVPESDIDSIITNVYMLGSNAGISSKAKELLLSLVNSGLYRRSYILDFEPKITERNSEPCSMDNLVEYFEQYETTLMTDFATRIQNNPLSEVFMTFTDEANSALIEIEEDIIRISNEDIYDNFKKSEIGSIKAIEDLAHIICFLEWRTEVTAKDIHDAYAFYQECRNSVRKTFRIKHAHLVMYDLILRGKPLTVTEMVELDDSIPTKKLALDDAVLLLEEHCYRKNQNLVISSGKISRYSIEDLPKSDINKMIVSVTEEEGPQAIDYAPKEVPFFGSEGSIEKLVASKIVSSFCCCYFNESPKVINTHRAKAYFRSGQNLVAFDVDNGMSIQEAQELCKNYTYILYTTKSHNTEKYEFRDRFRIIFPTKTIFYVDDEQHKKLYENLSVLLGLTTYDVATRNVSRMWFTNPDAIIYKNEADLLDISPCIPDTDKGDDIMPKLLDVDQMVDEERMDKRTAGMYKWFLSHTSANSNRNQNLYRVGNFFRDLGEDPTQHICSLNAMLSEPVDENELQGIIRSVARG